MGFVPLEYVPSIPPHSTYVIVIRTFREWVTIELHLEGKTMQTKSFVVIHYLYFDNKYSSGTKMSTGDYWEVSLGIAPFETE